MKPTRVDRRAVLRGAGGIAIGLPWLEAMQAPRAHAQSAAPKRLLVFFHANGVSRPNWFPTGTETDWALPPNLQPLAPFKDQLVVFRGLPNRAGVTTLNAHPVGTSTLLVGRKCVSDGYPNSAAATGISVDQEIANRLPIRTRLPSLQAGVLVRSPFLDIPPTTEWISFGAANKPLPPENDPVALFDRALVNVTPGQPVDPALARRQLVRKSAVDFVLTDAAALRRRLGQRDRARLDQHLTALTELEKRLAGTIADGGSLGCLPPSRPSTPPILRRSDGTVDFLRQNNDNYPAYGAAQIDLLVQAFACDVTRVATLTWGGAGEFWTYRWVPGLSQYIGHHDLTTSGISTEPDLAKMKTWTMTQLAALAGKLAALPEGNGTMLDNTLILSVTEIDWIYGHAFADMPWLLLGGKNLGVRGGRFLDLKGTRSTNDLLVSILNAMGFPDTTFGDPALGTGGPIPGLVG